MGRRDKKVAKNLLTTPAFIIVGTFFLLLFSQIVATAVLSLSIFNSLSDSIKTLINITIIGLAIALVLKYALKLYGGNITSLGLVKPNRPWIKVTVISVVLYFIFSSLFLVIVSAIFKSFDADQVQDVGITGALSISDKISAFISICLLTPIIEEVIFRGVVYRGLKLNGSFWVAALISSALFALAHEQWNVALDTFVLGIVLSYLVKRTDSIVPGILIHSLKNTVAFILLFVV